MGKASREKGVRAERALVALHEGLGVHAERVPLSGATHYRGSGADLDVYPWGKEGPPLIAEIKARGNGAGFTTIERWLGESDLLFLRRDRAEPLVCMPWSTWARLLRR